LQAGKEEGMKPQTQAKAGNLRRCGGLNQHSVCVLDLCTHGKKSQQKSSWDFTEKKLMQMPNPFIISLVMCHCPL